MVTQVMPVSHNKTSQQHVVLQTSLKVRLPAVDPRAASDAAFCQQQPAACAEWLHRSANLLHPELAVSLAASPAPETALVQQFSNSTQISTFASMCAPHTLMLVST